MPNNRDSDNNHNLDFRDNLPLLPLRDIVIYPFMIIPLFVGRESSIQVVQEACANHDQLIFLPAQKDVHEETPKPSSIFEVGTIAVIMRKRFLKDGRVKILVQGLTKARITSFTHSEPFYQVNLAPIEPTPKTPDPVVCEAMIRNVKESLEKIISKGKVLTQDILVILEDTKDPGRLANLIAANLNLKVNEAQMLLETICPLERLQHINDILQRELAIISAQDRMKSQTHEDPVKSQKEYFLREQIRAIKSELGEKSPSEMDEFQELRQKVQECKMSKEAEKESLEQISRLEKMHPDSSEAGILRTYVEWLLCLPWSTSTKDIINLEQAEIILNKDHFKLEKVKDRILEYLAVRKLKKGKVKGPILCFSGPPGVGKTSLGKSIAKSMNRKFARVSLGGVKDEAEIRGHRRTYVGAMPGRFIQSLKQAKTNNPVIMLDEIDKLGSDFKGDPSSALLEVLDAEQNFAFWDHYLNVPFDLSCIMFIATANVIDNIPEPLRDRMEIIYLAGYTQEEKVQIAKKYLIPKQIKENGITEDSIKFTEESLKYIIRNYTSEAGLRNIERQIGALCRKVARRIATNNHETLSLNPNSITKVLGSAPYTRNHQDKDDEIGVSTGLAWTSVGGEILHIESTTMHGKGLTLTGQLGDVMKESAQTAISYIKSQAKEYNIDPFFFENHELHLHLPAGAIPKDGPSAGLALALAILSSITKVPIKKNVAMTGEITLTGKALLVSGIKEKSLAAMRAGIETVIIPAQNKKDLDDIPEEYREKIKFVLIENFNQVLELAMDGWSKRLKNTTPSKATEKKTKKSKRNPPPCSETVKPVAA